LGYSAQFFLAIFDECYKLEQVGDSTSKKTTEAVEWVKLFIKQKRYIIFNSWQTIKRRKKLCFFYLKPNTLKLSVIGDYASY
jgi:hypothetical protein